jgi:hypothetical protein
MAVGKGGGARIIARIGVRHVHSIVPNQREWLSILVYINTAGQSIPSFYIFGSGKIIFNIAR